MHLPETLKPWRAWLDWFDPELAALVGELLLRLHPMLGAFRMRAQRGQVEPEGIDDLRRRGNYDRLLLSEWALADAAPEEFDRRAAGGEHLFLNPKLVAREVDALTVAVFDSGPAQLGAARLVHAAMWILLAQRAQAAKARFVWGVVHKPGELHAANSPEQLRLLLTSRTLEPGGATTSAANAADSASDCASPPRERLEREWILALDRADPSPGERWSIGLHTPGYGLGHRVDVLRANAEELSVIIASRQARREMRLRLPAPGQSARLLRGEFGRTIRAKVQAPAQVQKRGDGKLSLSHAPLISYDTPHVAAVLANWNAANIYVMPDVNQYRAKPPKMSRWWRRDEDWQAMALNGRELVGVAAQRDQIDFWQLGGRSFQQRIDASQLGVLPKHGRKPHAVLLKRIRDRVLRLFVLFNNGQLLSWTTMRGMHFGPDDPKLWNARSRDSEHYQVADNVLAVAQSARAQIIYLRQDSGYLDLQSIDCDANRDTLHRVAFEGTVDAVFIRVRSLANGWTGGFCIQQSVGGRGGERSSIWRVYQRDAGLPSKSRAMNDYEVLLPADWKVVGLGSPQVGEQCLVALRPDRRGLLSIGARHRRTLYESPVPIVQVSVAAGSDLIALIDASGRLIVVRERDPRVLVFEGENRVG